MAVVGSVLTAPEVGWQRFDDTNGLLTFEGTWYVMAEPDSYEDGARYSYNYGACVKFNFVGTKLRLIGTSGNGSDTSISVVIDGVEYGPFSQQTSYYVAQRLDFEVLGLDNIEHSVIITPSLPNTDTYYFFDALDIDSAGSLLLFDSNESEIYYINCTSTVTGTATGGSEYFTGESFDTAIPITDSSPVLCVIDTPDENVFYKFTATQSGECVIQASGTIDNNATLYDGNQVYITFDDDSGGNYQFKIVTTVTEGSTYYLELGLWDSNLTGSFYFSVVEESTGASGNCISISSLTGECQQFLILRGISSAHSSIVGDSYLLQRAVCSSIITGESTYIMSDYDLGYQLGLQTDFSKPEKPLPILVSKTKTVTADFKKGFMVGMTAATFMVPNRDYYFTIRPYDYVGSKVEVGAIFNGNRDIMTWFDTDDAYTSQFFVDGVLHASFIMDYYGEMVRFYLMYGDGLMSVQFLEIDQEIDPFILKIESSFRKNVEDIIGLNLNIYNLTNRVLQVKIEDEDPVNPRFILGATTGIVTLMG